METSHEKTIYKPIEWDIFDLIEAIARSLIMDSFSVNYRSSVEKTEYSSALKTIKLKPSSEDKIDIATIAHEL